MDLAKKISSQLSIPHLKVKATVDLLNDGNTLPFIARYRKEVTGNLDEEQIRNISESLVLLSKLEDRRKTVVKSIREQGKLDTKLENKIYSAENLTELEDLYLAYKPKRKTKASEARKMGLADLAELILQQPKTNKSLKDLAEPFLGIQVKTLENAWEGARFIVAEIISDNAAVRQLIRTKAQKWANLSATKINKSVDERGVYKNYYDFNYKINRIRPHQNLAINRGEKAKIIKVKIEISERDWKESIGEHYKTNPTSSLSSQLEEAIIDAAKRLLLPAIGRDIRRNLKEIAEVHAIEIFAKNLRALLSLTPLTGHTLLGLDPGYRSGCKIAVVDPSGKVLDFATIYPHKPQSRQPESLKILSNLISKHTVSLIAIGNGTASRESEELIALLIQNHPSDLEFLIVSEAGASVYSASKLAKAELPDLDVSIRGAVSIARRVQDPLAELVKIDPKSIGVGLYQHDVDQKKLTESLNSVVESVVNLVGVDLSTASVALLSHVSGIGDKLAKSIVDYRNQNGLFPERKNLKSVPGLGEKAFEQSAGFIRITNGKNPLDASGIHPESYRIAKAILHRAGISLQSSASERKSAIDKFLQEERIIKLTEELGIAKPRLLDICEQLTHPIRDPRTENSKPILRKEMLTMEELLPGLIIKGTVRNVVDFGAFVDIGVKQDGLLHISQIPKNVNLQVGNVLNFEIEKIDQDRGRISLLWVEN